MHIAFNRSIPELFAELFDPNGTDHLHYDLKVRIISFVESADWGDWHS